MAHYAKVENGLVTQVIVAGADVIQTLPGTWIAASYNTRGGIHYAPNSNTPDGGVAVRANFPCIGYIYDVVNDVFYDRKPYPSWTISAPTWIWMPPSPMPMDGKKYIWNESTLSWEMFGNP